MGIVLSSFACRMVISVFSMIKFNGVDPLTFTVLPLLLLIVMVLATWAPARRASLVDPMRALREEQAQFPGSDCMDVLHTLRTVDDGVRGGPIGIMIMEPKTVDSNRFLDGISKRAMKHWASLPGEPQIPWTPLAQPLSKCTVSLVGSAAIALKTDHLFDPEIEQRDPWFADPSHRVPPRRARTGDIHS